MKIKTRKKPLISLLSFSLLNLICSLNASANQTNNENKEKNAQQDTIVVTANRSEKSIWDSSVSVVAINREEIRRNNGDSIAETLRDIPGVEISDNALAGRKQIVIRGEAASRVLLLIDGQEVSYHRSSHGSGAGVLIDMESVERIELIKGPHSVLYGSQAIGGVVNFITRKGDENGNALNGHVKFIYNGATDGLTEMGSVYGSVNGIFDYRISGTYSEQGERKTPEGRLKDTDFDNNSLSSWFGLNLDKHKIGLSLDRYKLNTQTYVSESQLADMNSFLVSIPELKREKVGLFYDYEVDSNVITNLHIDGYYQTLERTFINKIDMSAPDMITNTQTQDEQKTKGINLQVDLEPVKNMKLIVGAQYIQDSVEQTSNKRVDMDTTMLSPPPPLMKYIKYTASSNSWQQNHYSLFAQNDWAITDNWDWNIGLRQYWVKSELKDGHQNISCTNMVGSGCVDKYIPDTPRKDSDNTLVVSTGLTYSGIDNTILRASFAQGYVYPTLTHLYAVTSAHTQTLYGNPDLEAEKSNNYELGLRFNNSKLVLDTAIYYSDAKNYITDKVCDGNSICNGTKGNKNIRYYVNANKAKTYGLEFTAEYLDLPVTPYFNGNIMRRQIETDSYKTYNTGNPIFSGNLGIKHTAFFSQVDLDSDLFMRVASSAKSKSSDTTYHYASWSTLNLSMVASFGPQRQYQLGLDLNNLLNKNYQTAHESIPAAKFHAVIAASMKF